MMANMKRSEAYHILGKMWEDATPEQAEAISIAQDDIEFVDLMPEDMVFVVRCKDCKHWAHGDCYRLELSRPNDFCSYGERREDDERN